MNPLTQTLNQLKMNEKELAAGVSGTKSSWHTEYKDSAWIFLGGLPYEMTEGDIICMFSQYGEPVHINLIRDHNNGKSKGFGFLCYMDQRSTVLAVDNLNGVKVLGRIIRVDHIHQYKLPKDLEKLDQDKRKLFEEGCAPKELSPSESEEEEEEDQLLEFKKPKKEKKKKKDKKVKKKKKKRRHSTDSEEDSEEDDKVKIKRFLDIPVKTESNGHNRMSARDMFEKDDIERNSRKERRSRSRSQDRRQRDRHEPQERRRRSISRDNRGARSRSRERSRRQRSRSRSRSVEERRRRDRSRSRSRDRRK